MSKPTLLVIFAVALGLLWPQIGASYLLDFLVENFCPHPPKGGSCYSHSWNEYVAMPVTITSYGLSAALTVMGALLAAPSKRAATAKFIYGVVAAVSSLFAVAMLVMFGTWGFHITFFFWVSPVFSGALALHWVCRTAAPRKLISGDEESSSGRALEGDARSGVTVDTGSP
jgi:hypothetical protein